LDNVIFTNDDDDDDKVKTFRETPQLATFEISRVTPKELRNTERVYPSAIFPVFGLTKIFYFRIIIIIIIITIKRR